MHPTTARYLIESRQSDLYAEAARERLARDARRAARPTASHGVVGLVAATRHLVASVLAIA